MHHLVFTIGVPLDKIASYFSQLCKPGGTLVLEFVPFEDSQVQRLLAARDVSDIDYSGESCIDAFSRFFSLELQYQLKDSYREMFVFKRRQ